MSKETNHPMRLLLLLLFLLAACIHPANADASEAASVTYSEPNRSSAQPNNEIRSVGVGDAVFSAITTDGNLWTWGQCSFNELGDGVTSSSRYYTPKEVMKEVESVFHSGSATAAILRDGSLWTWGQSYNHQLGNGTDEHFSTGTSWQSSEPTEILSDVRYVNLGKDTPSPHQACAAIKNDGTLWMWGTNNYGQVGTGTTDEVLKPVKILDNVRSVELGNDRTAAVLEDGSLLMWGLLDAGIVTKPTKVFDNVKSCALAPTSNNAAILEDDSLWVWGRNIDGSLGSDRGTIHSPTKLLEDVQSVQLEKYNSFILMNDGSLLTLGSNNHGLLGEGNEDLRASRSNPVAVLDNVQTFYADCYHVAALLKNGSVMMWGDNYVNGVSNLGDGTTKECRTAPVEILNDVRLASFSLFNSIAVQNDGSVWIWGSWAGMVNPSLPIEIEFDFPSTEPDVPLDPDNPGNPGGITPTKEFRIGTHSNSFVHSNTGTGENVGFAGVDDYSLSASSHEALADLCSSAGVLNAVKTRESSEWNGSCYGIAATMGLTYKGILPLSSISSGGNTYFSLALPCQDEKLLDAITFYQLSQFVDTGGDDFAAIESATRPSFIEGLTNYRGENSELRDFLKEIVETPEDGSVRMLEYFYSDSGHAILVIDATYDERNDRYIVKLYDENTVPRGKKGVEEGIFTIMIVDGDFSGFEIIGNDSKVIADETTYTAMHLLDLDRLPIYGATATSAAEPLAAGEKGASVTIELALNQPVDVTNSLGETLRYDGNKLSGDLEVIDISTIAGNQGSVLVIETTPSERFTFSSPGGTLDASAYDAQGEFCSVSGEGIDAATVSWGESLAIRGDESYELEAFLSTDRLVSDSETGLLSISGNASGEVSLTKDGEGISISGEISGATLASHESGRVYESEGVDVTTPIRVDHETLAAGDSPDWTSPYPDVREGDWYWDAVMFADTSGTMTGYANGTFGPADPVSRAQMATVLWRLADEPDSDATLLPDCDPESFYAAPVSWALGTGVFSGYESGLFGPADSLTREQAATVLWRRAGEPEGKADLSDFPDAESVSAFAREAMRWAVSERVITGTGQGALDPAGTCSRAELATILMRMDEAGKL